nr:pyroglutamyl-peptidase I [Tissierella sp.]
MKILITAFDPFGGETINPALEALKLMKDNIRGAEIIKLEIPTVFKESIEKTVEAIKKEKPDVVLNLGQAGGREGITPERVAINIDDAGIPDNKGNQPIDETIYKDGKNAYFASIPVKAIVKKLKESGIPSSLSNTAGSFVCNHIMYGTLYNIQIINPEIRAGFIHVPFIKEQVEGLKDKEGKAYMELLDITKGLELAVEAILENDRDIKTIEGKTH